MIRDANPASANDRLKGRFQEIVGGSLIAATVGHLLLFLLFPEMTASPLVDPSDPPLTIVQPEDIDYPDEPPPLDQPLAPVVAVDADPTATIEPPDWDRVPHQPPPPPLDDASGGDDASPFYTYEVAPRLQNPGELQRALHRVYPTALRDARIGGTVTLEVFIDAEGTPGEARVFDSSGHRLLDEAAVGLIDVMRFSPALNRDRRVPVWVRIPISFETRNDEARRG